MTEKEELVQLILSFTPEELNRALILTREYLSKGSASQKPAPETSSE